MKRVFILVEAVDEGERVEAAVLEKMVAALKVAIATFPHPSEPHIAVEIRPVASLQAVQLEPLDIICPLTLNLPNFVSFPGREIYQACQDISGLRQRVQQLGYVTGAGNFWLPVVLTAKGALYAEAIGSEPSAPPRFYQPLHLSDRWRQPLYWLGQRLVQSLSAPPTAYLIQFGFQDETICFDRLLPFPAAPAIASLSVQAPDLFACHWLCITHQPVLDLVILPQRDQNFEF